MNLFFWNNCAEGNNSVCLWWQWKNNTSSIKNFSMHFLQFYLSLRCFCSVFFSQRGINLDCGYKKCTHISLLSSSALSHITWLLSDISLALLFCFFFPIFVCHKNLILTWSIYFTNSLKRTAKPYFSFSVLALLCVCWGDPHLHRVSSSSTSAFCGWYDIIRTKGKNMLK